MGLGARQLGRLCAGIAEAQKRGLEASLVPGGAATSARPRQTRLRGMEKNWKFARVVLRRTAGKQVPSPFSSLSVSYQHSCWSIRTGSQLAKGNVFAES